MSEPRSEHGPPMPCPLCTTSEDEQVFHINDTCDAVEVLSRAATSPTVSRAATGLIGDSVMVTQRGIEHTGCRYMAALFAGVENPDQRIWFCNKCGNGGVLNPTQTAIAEVLHMTVARLKADHFGSGRSDV